MIPLAREIDLGLDKERMSDARDVQRQMATARELLKRLFADREDDQIELQILADEVGMGKTFVALAVAYSILRAQRDDPQAGEALKGCYKKVLVLTPGNDALYRKWEREASEFVKRCIPKAETGSWFKAQRCDRIDDLVAAVRNPKAPPVLVVKTSRLESVQIQDRGIKNHFMLAGLCRYWSNRFPRENRTLLLKGAPEGWPRDDRELGHLFDDERERLHFDEDEINKVLQRVEQGSASDDRELMEHALERAKDLGTPYRRDRADAFRAFRMSLSKVYRRACLELLRQSFPLVVVDEAHNWKNGPSGGANGYYTFRDHLGPRARRLLLLSATPFQLRPQEMLEILKSSDCLDLSEERRAALRRRREQTLKKALRQSESESREFAKAWARLPKRISPSLIAETWASRELAEARTKLEEATAVPDIVDAGEVDQIAKKAVQNLDADFRGFFLRALTLFAMNRDLSHELGRVVVRHRRETGHRLVRVGEEYAQHEEKTKGRPDHMVLHAAPGLNVTGDAELPHYLLMRAVSELKGGRGRTALGTTLTGTYSTLAASQEGASLRRNLESGPASLYLRMLKDLVGEKEDETHPKVKALVNDVFEKWERGEKYLVFCFRSHTSRRLRAIIAARIGRRIDELRTSRLGSEKALEYLKNRMTGRDRDLMPLVLDRVLWSASLSDRDHGLPIADLAPQDADFAVLAELGLRHGVDLTSERVDRVFLHRAVEHAIARRLIAGPARDRRWRLLLDRIASREWVASPYGLESPQSEQEEVDEALTTQRRGVHHRYDVVEEGPSKKEIELLAGRLREREERAARGGGRFGLVDGVAISPNLWLGPEPLKMHPPSETGASLHRLLWRLTPNVSDESGWLDRLHVLAAFRRAILRESTLVRLLPSQAQRDEEGWGFLLAEAVANDMPGQTETFLHRLVVFAEDFVASTGSASEPDSSRGAMLRSTLLRDDSLVTLVDGNTGQEQRDRVFSGFNTPFLPDVLICTSVGQEGIDLHRHCRHVVHYDLPWNPATIEQRTGRADRIGSKTFREREAERRRGQPPSFLSVGVPYLAGTYDERIYEEVRVRAQTFEVLTGGSFAADHAEGAVEEKDDEGMRSGLSALPLPVSMLDQLRVRLEVADASSQVE